ncbi:uncharacterized protein Bfra_004446 [Botrytis fragariae]|uniref:Uncharacterized protein n=1 Tax=Botrytis fragariae TaxID=1964551 RepID=A0A8H6EJF6_9HELO|nr:uncharacterized protein Bfra_004446 [Botrytis fragariae]KAF5874439.1 hypothetical protein Bfra_004446 [Botrytis fragariae]
MSGYNTNDIGSNDNQQEPHDTGTERPYPLNDRPFGAIRHRLASMRTLTIPGVPSPPINQYNHHASNGIDDSFNPHQQGMDGRQMAPNTNQRGVQVIPVDLIPPQSQVPMFDSQYLNGGDQLPDYHANNIEYTANPQLPAHYRDDLTLIDHDQVPQWPVYHTNHPSIIIHPHMPAYQHVEGTPISHGQQLPPSPVHHGHTVNPQMLACHQVEETPINHGQQSQLPINSIQHQPQDTSHNFGQLQSQISTDYVDGGEYIEIPEITAHHHQNEGTPTSHYQQSPQSPLYHGYTVNPQMSAFHQVEETSINHDRQPHLSINGNQHQAQDLPYNSGQQQIQIEGNYASDMEHGIGQQAFINYPFQIASTHFDQPLPMSVYVTNNNGHDISQRLPVHFPVGGTTAHSGQVPQMPVNQINFNGVNDNQQAYQGMATAAVSSFANLSAQEQNAEFQHFFQQRLALGETQLMEFETFKKWYIGQQLRGNITPTLEHGVTPLHHTLVFNNNVPIQQPMISPNNQKYMQPPTMIYQNTGREFTTGFQHTMGPPTTLNGQAMQPNNEQYLKQPRKSINSDIRTRRTSLAVASAGQSRLPVSSPSMALPAQLLNTTMPDPSSTTERLAPPSTTRAQAPPLTTTMPAPPSTTGVLAVTGRNPKTEATPATQRMSVSIDQLISSAGGKYTVFLSDLPEVFVSDQPFDTEFYHLLDHEIEVMDTKAAKANTKVFMLRNEESLAIVRMALGELLQQSIAHLSLDTSSDARQSLEHYVTTRNIGSSLIKSLAFAPESQFVKEEIKVVRGTEQTVRLAKDSIPVPAKHTIMGNTINSDLNGTEVKGSYSLYTKTTFLDPTTPLKYAIGLEIQVAEVGDRRVRRGLLNYERSLPSNIVGEPLWADILDLLKMQATEWDINTRIQDSSTCQTSTLTSLSNQQQSDKEENGTEEQWPISGPVQRQRARTRQSITPELRRVRGEKRKRQQQPELHSSGIFASSSEEPNFSSDHGKSPMSNTSTESTSISPHLVAGEPRFSDNSMPIKRSKNGYEMVLPEGGTGMKKSSPLRGQARLTSILQPLMQQISQNDHMHPARSPSDIVRSPFTTETQSSMPAQVSAQAHESTVAAEIAIHRQGMLLASNERPYQYLISELTQPSRTFSAQNNMPTPVQTRLLREPTEAELAPYRKKVNGLWKSAFPVEKKSS